MEVKLESKITCPKCNHIKEEIMPENFCMFFYECEECHELFKPLSGDCCVFCSYGTEKCPSIQLNNSCC